MMEVCINKELDYRNQNNMNEERTGLDDEDGDKSTETQNEYIIHMNIKVNETETNQDTLDKVIE